MRMLLFFVFVFFSNFVMRAMIFFFVFFGFFVALHAVLNALFAFFLRFFGALNFAAAYAVYPFMTATVSAVRWSIVVFCRVL